MTADPSKQQFWDSFLLAVETEPREPREIRGASGFVHPVLAIGVDEKRSRTVIVSGDFDARMASLAQADIQAAKPSTKIVMARPVGINLQTFASSLVGYLGTTRMPMSFFKAFSSESGKKTGKKGGKKREELFKEIFGNHVEAACRPFQYVDLNTVSFWKELIQQISFLEVEGWGVRDSVTSQLKGDHTLNLEHLLKFDPIALDRNGGVCAVPLYELGEPDFELFAQNATEAVRAILLRHQIFQYFFPAADQIALAAADRGAPVSTASILHQVRFAPEAGHPLARNEIVDPQTDLLDTVTALMGKKFLVEGSISTEISPSGKVVRTEVKLRPREGLCRNYPALFRSRLT